MLIDGELPGVGDHLVAFEHEKALVSHDEARLLFGIDREGEIIAGEYLGVGSFPHKGCDFCGGGGDNILWFGLDAFGSSLVGILRS